jgi:hypothetical protein
MLRDIKKTYLKKLNSVKGENLLTVYVPLEKGVIGHKFNKSQLHNLRSELKNYLTKDQHDKLSSELELVIGNLGYSNESLGFAMFYDGDEISCYTLPFEPIKLINKSTSFDTKQIKDYYKKNIIYYVLAISKKGSKLYKGNFEELKMVPVSGLGKDLESTLGVDPDQPRIVQNHQVSAGGQGGVGFHGHGGYKDFKKTLFDDYLRFIDNKILLAIKDKKTPLVLVAVDYGQSAYKHISKYPSIFKQGISTNPDVLSPLELHNRTQKLFNMSN